MALFKLPRTSQPQNGASLSPIGFGSPLTYADVGSFPVVSKYAPTITGVNTKQPSVKGMGRKFDGVSDGLSFATGAVVDNTKAFTVVVQFNPSSLTGGSVYAHIATLQSVQGTTPFELVATNAGAGYDSILFGSAASWLTGGLSTNGIIAVGSWYTVVLCYNGNGAGTLSNYSIYINGTKQTLAAASGFSILANQTTVAVPPSGGANNKFAGLITLLSVLPSGFSETGLKSLSDNPWQIFTPVSRKIWVPASASGTHPSSGALAADPATIAGAAIRLAMHTSSGALAAQAASIAGTATRFITHPSSGALASDAATIAGTAARASAGLHPSSGALAADSATIAGTAAHLTLHTSSGALAGQDASIAGTAAHFSLHPSSGDLAAQDAVIAGTALRTTPTLPTVGRPASDTSNSGWLPSTGTDLYPMLDEVVPDAADYIYATAVGAICEVALDTTAYPGTASQVLKFRGSSSTGNSVIVRLKNTGGATVRSTTQALTVTDTEYTVTLTSGEIAAITSGSLSVEMESA